MHSNTAYYNINKNDNGGFLIQSIYKLFQQDLIIKQNHLESLLTKISKNVDLLSGQRQCFECIQHDVHNEIYFRPRSMN